MTAGLSARMVPANEWADTWARFRAQGMQLLALTAYREHVVCAYFADACGSIAAVGVRVTGNGFPSMARQWPEVQWDEREIRDLFGYEPLGHPDLRPLIRTPRWPCGQYPLRDAVRSMKFDRTRAPDNPAVTASGEGVTIMTVGPTHAGIIESGHFVFSLMGENVLHVDAHLFQNHRGVEGFLEGLPVSEVGRVVTRICGADTVSHQVNWAGAVEQLAGFEASEVLAARRLILMESERVLSHLNDLAQIPAGTGFQVAHHRGLALKELWQRGLQTLYGHRFLFDVVRPAVADPPSAEMAAFLPTFQSEWARWRRMVERHQGFQDRLHGVGRLARRDAERLGVVGPAARASGLQIDARTWHPYYRGVHWAQAGDHRGDVAARFLVRLDEVESSLALIADAAHRAQREPASRPREVPPDLSGDVVTTSESPHGLNVHTVRLARGRVDRYHVRSACFRNWPAVARTVGGQAVADFPLINKSFELCYSCTDR